MVQIIFFEGFFKVFYLQNSIQLNSVAVTGHLRKIKKGGCLKLLPSSLIFHEIFEKHLIDYLQSDLIWLENSINFPEMFRGL